MPRRYYLRLWINDRLSRLARRWQKGKCRDMKRERYLMWKHWGWRNAGTPRGMRLRYWFHDRLSRLAHRWQKGRG